MKSRIKSYIIVALGIFITLSGLTSWFLLMTTPGSQGGPDFYAISREVSLNEMIDVANDNNLSIYLPSEMPNNLELTAIYLRNWSFLAIVVYSAEKNKDYKTAEFGIQIVPTEITPTYDELRAEAEESEHILALELNGWPIIINERAYAGGNIETRERWGDWLLLVRIWIEGIGYTLVAPTLNTDDVIKVVEGMSSLAQ